MAQENGSPNTLNIVNLVLLVVIIVLGLTGTFGTSGSGTLTKADVEDAVTQALDDYDFPAAAAPSDDNNQPTADAQPQPQPTADNKLALSRLEEFYEQSYTSGPEDAPVTIIEFSDFECPFCQRHAQQGTIQQVMDKYEGNVNYVLTHFPLNNIHPLAQDAAEAAECIGQQGGAEAFYAYKEAIFQQNKPTRDAINTVAEGIDGIDLEAMNDCIDSGEFSDKVANMMSLGRELGVTGTPGNIVIDNDTGEYRKVSGAVPSSAFDGPVSSFLDE